MILSRSYYVDLPLRRWLQLRLLLVWQRLSRSYPRSIGTGSHLSLTPPELRRQYSLPVVRDPRRSTELDRALRICPTRAISTDRGAYNVDDLACIRCGLCYLVAPDALGTADD